MVGAFDCFDLGADLGRVDALFVLDGAVHVGIQLAHVVG